MSKTTQTPDWNHIRAFLATATEGSLSAAARALGLTQPTLSRQVAALEEELGVLLFERIGRTLELTQAGVELLDHTRAMGEAADRFALVADGQSQAIEGDVHITAADVFSVYLLPPMLEKLREVAPQLHINVIASNDIQDLMRREADIALRHVRPDQPDLIARLVGEPKAYYYASPSYLQKHGTPTKVEDLKDHHFIAFGDKQEMVDYLNPHGANLTTANFPLSSKNGIVAWEFCRKGFGIAVMGDFVGETCDMVRLLPDHEPFSFPMWLVTHRELHTSRKIRLVFDLIADHLKAMK